MKSSVEKQIEKIKMQEQDNENKLRQKRELDNAIVSTNRAIRDSLTQLGKLCEEYQHLTATIDKLIHQVAVEKLRYTALSTEIQNNFKRLKELLDISHDAWMRVSTVMEIPIEELKKKKDSLMSSYRSYKGKVKKSIQSGAGADDIYQPTWFAFEAMNAFFGR
ncbi:hypothetical protein HF086_007823 [Spodoptera exigua]|uniref:Uncharacterized protein n=1 Tax=Spodoptera exigua TaxID=7107 RepID=A0A922M253_SPOEX|nr:hypothetical protein HF086_007823 [Spodoptera exigua]